MKWIIKSKKGNYLASYCQCLIFKSDLKEANRFDTMKAAKATFKKYMMESYCTIEKIES